MNEFTLWIKGEDGLWSPMIGASTKDKLENVARRLGDEGVTFKIVERPRITRADLVEG